MEPVLTKRLAGGGKASRYSSYHLKSGSITTTKSAFANVCLTARTSEARPYEHCWVDLLRELARLQKIAANWLCDKLYLSLVGGSPDRTFTTYWVPSCSIGGV